MFITYHILIDVDWAEICLTYDDSMEDTLIGEVIVFGDYHLNYVFGKFDLWLFKDIPYQADW